MANLTLEAQEEIRRHVWRVVVLPAVGLVVLSFVLGFAINRVAWSEAYRKALEDLTKPMSEALATAKGAQDIVSGLRKDIADARVGIDNIEDTRKERSAKLAN